MPSSSGLHHFHPRFRILQWNCNHSLDALEALMHLVTTNQIFTAAVLVQEIPEKIRYLTHLNNYKVFCPKVPYSEQHTCILLHNSLPAIEHYSTCGRITSLSLTLDQSLLTLISLYVRHSNGVGLSQLQPFVEGLPDRPRKLLIGLDANASSSLWGPSGTITSDLAPRVWDTLTGLGLCILNSSNSSPTFFDPVGRPHWLDITAAHPDLAVTNWYVIDRPQNLSDHNVLATEISAPLAPKVQVQRW